MIHEALSDAVKFAVATSALDSLDWLSGRSSYLGKEFQASIREQVESNRREVQDHIKQGVAIRNNLWRVFAENEVRVAHIALISQVIEALEQRAASEAAAHRQAMKRLIKTGKKLSEVDPSQNRFFAWAVRQLEEIGRLEIDDKTDFALFLRALRAEREPKPASEGDFLDPDALEQFLNRSLTV